MLEAREGISKMWLSEGGGISAPGHPSARHFSGNWILPCACLLRTWPGVGLQAASKPQTTKAVVNSSAERHNKGLKKQVSMPFCNWIMHPPWRREWQPALVFLPGESYGQRSLAGHSPRGRKESDMTE